jgi:hypothetical protein
VGDISRVGVLGELYRGYEGVPSNKYEETRQGLMASDYKVVKMTGAEDNDLSKSKEKILLTVRETRMSDVYALSAVQSGLRGKFGPLSCGTIEGPIASEKTWRALFMKVSILQYSKTQSCNRSVISDSI